MGKVKQAMYEEDGTAYDVDTIYCNVCGEGYPVKDIGITFGGITCISCADNMGEPLRDRGMAQ